MRFNSSVLIIFSFIAITYADSQATAVHTLLKKQFKSYGSIKHVQIKIEDSVIATISNSTNGQIRDPIVHLFTIKDDSCIIGYAVADSVQSKNSVVSICVLINRSGAINSVHILNKVDSRSARLHAKAWRTQFEGKTNILIKDINAISGATISSRAITEAVAFLLGFARTII